MTVRDFFDMLQAYPSTIFYYFGILFLLTIVAGLLLQKDGELTPWKYLYTVIIYMVSVPGIFALTLSVYFFFFERRSIMDTDLLIQVLPIVTMVATFLIIRRTVSLDIIPGFGTLTSLMIIIFVILSILWVLDRTHIYAIAFMPIGFIILCILGGILALQYAIKRIMS